MSLPKFEFTGDKEQWDESTETNVLITDFESGKEQRREKSPARRRFSLPFSQLRTQVDEIIEFYNNRAGPTEPFIWEHYITGEEIVVRFANETLTRQHFFDVGSEFSLELVELLGEGE